MIPGLHLIRLQFGQVYLWNDDGELTLVDTVLPGAAGEIAQAIGELGFSRSALRRVVLTHFHNDHTGSAAELTAWGDVEVLAGAADAPIIRGDVPGPPPVLTEEEKPLYDAIVVRPKLPPAPPCRVDRELREGDRVEFGGGARVLSIPGHTDGSIALYTEEQACCSSATRSPTPAGSRSWVSSTSTGSRRSRRCDGSRRWTRPWCASDTATRS
jgi:glyoxylase-like metal-dependent hydrolase (beta-lactamase superfamily II)